MEAKAKAVDGRLKEAAEAKEKLTTVASLILGYFKCF